MTEPTCPHCSVAMEEGFILDRGHYNALNQPSWVEGVPERSFWQGLNVRGRDQGSVVTYRCPRCGLLQSYVKPA